MRNKYCWESFVKPHMCEGYLREEQVTKRAVSRVVVAGRIRSFLEWVIPLGWGDI